MGNFYSFEYHLFQFNFPLCVCDIHIKFILSITVLDELEVINMRRSFSLLGYYSIEIVNFACNLSSSNSFLQCQFAIASRVVLSPKRRKSRT